MYKYESEADDFLPVSAGVTVNLVQVNIGPFGPNSLLKLVWQVIFTSGSGPGKFS